MHQSLHLEVAQDLSFFQSPEDFQSLFSSRWEWVNLRRSSRSSFLRKRTFLPNEVSSLYLLYITLSLTLPWGRDNYNCYFSPFPPWSLSRQRSSTTVSVVLAGFMSLALAFLGHYAQFKRTIWFNDLWIWRYFNDLLKQQWRTACNWVTEGVLHNCDSHWKEYISYCLFAFFTKADPDKPTSGFERKWTETE